MQYVQYYVQYVPEASKFKVQASGASKSQQSGSDSCYFEDLLSLFKPLQKLCFFLTFTFMKVTAVPQPFVGLVLRQSDRRGQLPDIFRSYSFPRIVA